MLYTVQKLLQVQSICYAIADSSKIIGKESREENKVMHVIKTKPKHQAIRQALLSKPKP